MKDYFYAKNKEKFGPYPLGVLKTKPITPQTLIWHQGLDNWKKASEFPELKDIFHNITGDSSNEPAVAPKKYQNTTKAQLTTSHFERPPKTWLVESILATLFCCFPFGIAGIVNASNVESKFRRGDVEGAKRSSQQAATWTKVSFFVQLGLVIIYILCMIFIGSRSIFPTNY